MSFFLLKKKNECDDALMTASKSSDSDSGETTAIKGASKEVILNPEWLRHWEVTPKSAIKFLSM
jgi:hypothetical protein